jgi:hypothetical protein
MRKNRMHFFKKIVLQWRANSETSLASVVLQSLAYWLRTDKHKSGEQVVKLVALLPARPAMLHPLNLDQKQLNLRVLLLKQQQFCLVPPDRHVEHYYSNSD